MSTTQPDPETDTERWSAAYWDAHYQTRDQLWSGRPNPWLVTDAGPLPPGHALDVGCGECADAIWLATRGWTVTALDISELALDRARTAATSAGVADRITFLAEDARTTAPDVAAYDLVSAHFMHLPSALRTPFHARLAAAVAPGGTLLVVLHHVSEVDGPMPRSTHDRDLFASEHDLAADLAAGTDPGDWEVQAVDDRTRPASHPDGHQIEVHDAVLRARRRPADRMWNDGTRERTSPPSGQ